MIGCGGRAQAHMAAMLSSKAIDLVAICDLDEAKLKAAGEKFGVKKLYNSMEEAIGTEKPEFVDICTPPTIRTSIVEPAINAGAPHILIEKPIALKPSESRRLVELGKDRLIAVNTQYQWMPHWQRFWEILAKKELGDIRYIRASTKADILEQGPHTLDLAMKAARISGLPDPEWVIAGATGVAYHGAIPVPGDVTAIAGLGDARLFINHGATAPEVPGESVFWYHIQVDIVGTKGRLWVTLNQGWTLWQNGKFSKGKTDWGKNDGQSQAGLYKELRDRIHGGTWQEFPTRVEIAAKNSELMMATYLAALNNAKVDLPTKLPDSLVNRVGRLAK
jgi:predicted dehydrogenase